MLSWLKSKLFSRPPVEAPEAQPLSPLHLPLHISEEALAQLSEIFTLKRKVRVLTPPNSKVPLEVKQEFLEIVSGELTAEISKDAFNGEVTIRFPRHEVMENCTVTRPSSPLSDDFDVRFSVSGPKDKAPLTPAIKAALMAATERYWFSFELKDGVIKASALDRDDLDILSFLTKDAIDELFAVAQACIARSEL